MNKISNECVLTVKSDDSYFQHAHTHTQKRLSTIIHAFVLNLNKANYLKDVDRPQVSR